jgi:OOP family OmpA-OmpF porin
MLQRIGLAIVTLALGACAVRGGPAGEAKATLPGYVTSSGGVVKNGFGLCWHTRGWTPDKAIAPCDPVAVAQLPAPAPVQAPVQSAAAPRAVPAPEPMPAAAPKPAPRPPVLQRVALDTELLFDFDSAVLRPAGRAKLDQIALKLHGARIASIEAMGHADRIASGGYYQALSEERAAAVSAYLAKLGFDSRAIHAEGRGETDPVTGARCAGLGPEHRDNLKLVRCLQPDRRVELEVRGVKKGAT